MGIKAGTMVNFQHSFQSSLRKNIEQKWLGVRVVECKICQGFVVNRDDLEAHMKIVHYDVSDVSDSEEEDTDDDTDDDDPDYVPDN